MAFLTPNSTRARSMNGSRVVFYQQTVLQSDLAPCWYPPPIETQQWNLNFITAGLVHGTTGTEHRSGLL